LIAIQSALKIEVELIRRRLSNATTQRSGGVEYVTGTIGQKEIVLAAGGIGSTRAGACARSLIEHFHVESIIFCGVAGRINPRLEVGDIVISREGVQYDRMEESTSGIPGDSCSKSGIRIRADQDLVDLAQKVAAETVGDGSCVTGIILTGDRPVVSHRRRMMLLRTYGGDCVEMEGAAVGSVCVADSVPFVVVRAISDRAGPFASFEFRRNIRTSARRVQEVVLRLLSLPTS